MTRPRTSTIAALIMAWIAIFPVTYAAGLQVEIVNDTFHGVVGVGAGKGACDAGCSGAFTIAAGASNCHGSPGGSGCDGRVGSINVGDGNCHGGDGSSGKNGGSGCESEANLNLGNGNCQGGSGGDGASGLPGGSGGEGCGDGVNGNVGDGNCQGGDGGSG